MDHMTRRSIVLDSVDRPGPRDFNRKVLNALKKKGITITGITNLPGKGGDFANGERGYNVTDNGKGRVLTYKEVLKEAEEVA